MVRISAAGQAATTNALPIHFTVVFDDGTIRHLIGNAVLVLLRHADDPQPLIVEGQWKGTILQQRRGSGLLATAAAV